ncbi:MAG: IS1595 family transposase [Chloroflexota bacterium]|nr:IS1595 family transposase [Chloroflexota bacterium]
MSVDIAAAELNLSTLAKHFSDEEAAYGLVERMRWPHGPICPHCGIVDDATYLAPKDGPRKTSTGKVSYRRVWQCNECRKQFSVLVGTVFEDSKIPLSKWLLAMHMMQAGKNGVAALELHRTLGITYKSAWFMAHRIRYAMGETPFVEKMKGIVEADETYIGGVEKGKRGRPGKDSKKTPVVSLVERGGNVRSKVVTDVSGATLKEVLDTNIAPDARLMTDSFVAYREPGKAFASHETVDHGKDEYVRGDVYTNTAEGYFSQLKRSIDGTHHSVSEKHLPSYLGEFDYRYNTRKMKDGERTERAIQQTAGKRLRYKEPVEKSTD